MTSKKSPKHLKTADIDGPTLAKCLTVDAILDTTPLMKGCPIPDYSTYPCVNSSDRPKLAMLADFIPTLTNITVATEGLRISQKTAEAGWDEAFKGKFIESYRTDKARKPTPAIISGNRFVQCRQLRIMLSHFQRDQSRSSSKVDSVGDEAETPRDEFDIEDVDEQELQNYFKLISEVARCRMT
ncbi:unnamed protein product [Prorocentrum cordatum]|uniref:Uncharacterized protein n=1 Tax=Prorocentrum cordatum TaxID=2364126 RepID=A0ABN9UWG2_9DINO|nr:unnamed protein product [Polarella glacialis]